MQHFAKRNGFWYYLDSRTQQGEDNVYATLYIPEDRSLRTELLRRYHEAPASGHFGAEKSWRAIRRGYFWPGLRTDMMRYVHSCEACQRQAEPNKAKYGLLHPLPIPGDRGTDIAIDFFDMPRDSEGFDQVLLIVDRLTKLAALIPAKATDSTATTAQRFIQSWFASGKGLPERISSDRDALFTSKLWTEICKQLEISHTMTTARHQSANGQAEIYVRTVKKVLKKQLNYKKDNWKTLLPLVEFSLNNAEHATTGYTPFFLFNGFSPRVFPDEVINSPANTNQLLQDIGRALQSAKQNLLEAQEEMKTKSSRTPAPVFETGSSVWLLNEGFTWTESQKESKLQDKKLGPFCVKRGNDPGSADPNLALNVELELPPSMLHKQIHPIFHVSKLEKFVNSSPLEFPDRQQYQEAPVDIVDGKGQFEIKEILDHRLLGQKLQYLVHLRGCERREAEWNDYSEDDPDWDVDRHWIQAYQEEHGLPTGKKTRVSRKESGRTTKPRKRVQFAETVLNQADKTLRRSSRKKDTT